MIILIIISVIFLVLLVGLLITFIFSRADRSVVNMHAGMAAEERAYNPALTLGHKVKVESTYEEQLKQARLEAARIAAAMPRGANNRVGRGGKSTLTTAGKSVAKDPVTAVRVAHFHGWDGARSGAPSVNAMAAAAAAPAAVVAAPAVAVPTAPAIPRPTLIAITPEMTPEEVRKARIANSKAEAAYNKALKAAGATAGAVQPQVAIATAAPVAAAPVAAAPAAVGIEKPQLIEITEGMAPEEIRKARVANAKAEAAYNKALKAAGVDPSSLKAGAAVPVAAAPAVASVEAAPAAPAVAAAPVAPAAAVPTGITPPKLIEITEGMAPEEVRRARVENAKATAAYNKALKAAGIDPASLK
ncbi:MAG: hypothetical protein KJ046_13670 [Anaerolineae bacterium]|nr:hypothetical protein [Anaerolineae bacterium]RIK23111.1 MAG: hypothetical protein DCC51_04190 [Anaerolineae bacterium]